MINLYSKDNTNFNNNGLATLTPISCMFEASINGVWKLEIEIPYDAEERFKKVAHDMIIKVDKIDCINSAYYGQNQLFRIYDYKKLDDRMWILAYPVGLDARFDTFTESLNLSGKTASQAVSLINGMSNKYTVSTDLNVNAPEGSHLYENQNMISILNGDDAFVKTWGGEIVYDNYNIKVRRNCGSSDEADVRYGKNLSSMEYDYDTSNVVTRVYPKSQNGDALNGINAYKIANTRYVDSDQLSQYPFPRIYFTQTPYHLLQTSDDGSECYTRTIELINDIKSTARQLIKQRFIDFQNDRSFDNDDVAWYKWFHDKTLERDGFKGGAERYAEAIINYTSPTYGHALLSSEFKEFAKKYIIEGVKEFFGNDVESTSYTWTDVSGSGQTYTCQFLLDAPAVWYTSAWAKDGSTWKYIKANGYHESSSREDKKTWKWYKPSSNSSYKRYGHKSKGWYLASEMWKIDGEWYWFDENGKSYKGKKLRDGDESTGFTGKAWYFEGIWESESGTYQDVDLVDILVNAEKSFFQAMYTNMTTYVNNYYSEGADKPIVNISVDMVDLKNSIEYKDFQNLIDVHLGDTVNCINYKTGILTRERVIGVTYDVLRGYNTNIEIGVASNSVINILSEIGKTDGVHLVAGEGITIENNVIALKPQPTTGVQDVLVNGESVVDGHIAYVDGSGFGLQWWEEEEDSFYRNGSRVAYDFSATTDDGAGGRKPITYTSLSWVCFEGGLQAGNWFDFNSTKKAIIGTLGYGNNIGFVIMSLGSVSCSWMDRDYMTGARVHSQEHLYGQFYRGSAEVSGITWNLLVYKFDAYNAMATGIDGDDRNNPLPYLGQQTPSDDIQAIAEFILNSSGDAGAGQPAKVVIEETDVPYVTDIGMDDYAFLYGKGTKEEVTEEIASIDTDGNAKFKSVTTDKGNVDTRIDSKVSDVKVDGVSVVDSNKVANLTSGVSEVTITPTLQSGTKIADYEIDGNSGELYAPSGGGGGSDVSITPTLQSGEKIADYEIDGVAGALYAPTGGGSDGKQTIPYKCLTPAQYESLSNSEKNNGVMYFVSEDAQGEEGYFLPFRNLTESEYEDIQASNGVLYLVSDNSNGTYGINHIVSNTRVNVKNTPCWIGG